MYNLQHPQQLLGKGEGETGSFTFLLDNLLR